jgi:hypothetical protein
MTTVLNDQDHPPKAKVLLMEKGQSNLLFEIEIVEWSPAGLYPYVYFWDRNLDYKVREQRWIYPYNYEVLEVLSKPE